MACPRPAAARRRGGYTRKPLTSRLRILSGFSLEEAYLHYQPRKHIVTRKSAGGVHSMGTEIRIGESKDEMETLGGTQPVYGPAIPDVRLTTKMKP